VAFEATLLKHRRLEAILRQNAVENSGKSGNKTVFRVWLIYHKFPNIRAWALAMTRLGPHHSDDFQTDLEK
jgi:hypothetical protein